MEDCLREKIAVLRERMKISPNDKLVYQELSDLLFQAGKISAAMNILEKSMASPTGSASNDLGSNLNELNAKTTERQVERGAKWLFERGLEFADAYLYEDAIECLSQALEVGLNTFETHYCLAGVYKSLDRISEAEFYCRRSLTLNPRFAPGYILLGALLKKPGCLEESVSACKKAVLLDPECTAAYYDLACYYSLLSKCEQSLTAIEMALCKGFADYDWLLQDPDLEAMRQLPEFKILIQSYRQKQT
jgi:tetratricopeptide (TPR) repeat protein